MDNILYIRLEGDSIKGLLLYDNKGNNYYSDNNFFTRTFYMLGQEVSKSKNQEIIKSFNKENYYKYFIDNDIFKKILKMTNYEIQSINIKDFIFRLGLLEAYL